MLKFLKNIKKKFSHAKKHQNPITESENDAAPLALEPKVVMPKDEQPATPKLTVTFESKAAPEIQATAPLVQEKERVIYGSRTKASARKHSIPPSTEKVAQVTAQLEDIKAPSLSMKEAIELKAREIQFRTGHHNEIYRGEGKDLLHLEGRPLKSAFENEQGEKLPVEKRQEIMRDLQTGKRKRAWQ